MRRDRPIETSGLRQALEKVLAKDSARRLFAVEEILRPTYEAYPKNSAGKIALQSLHSMVRGYFAEEHGWLFSGFEFTGSRSTKLSEAKLLHEKAEKVGIALEEAETAGEGLSLSDTVVAIAAVEHLVLQESVDLLHRAYELNKAEPKTSVTMHMLENLLESYLMIFRGGRNALLATPEQHMHAREEFHQNPERNSLGSLRAFYNESIHSYGVQEGYSLSDTEQIVKDVALRYGRWQNAECEEMKSVLMTLDPRGTGRVPLDVFHAQPKNVHFSFTESEEYLKEINSLDTTRKGGPKVMIANYLASPSNCIAWSAYFSVCCLNECESLVNALEARVQTSEVPVETFLEVVADLSSSSVKAPRKLPPRLADMARSVAAVHSGVVPLLSGDFRRWFHFAFPNECHYPTDLEAEQEESVRDAVEKFVAGLEPNDDEMEIKGGEGLDL